MKCDQPFCIIGSKGRFRGVHYGYLPALEEPEIPKKEEVYLDMRWTSRQWDIINQLRGEVAYLRNKIIETKKQRKSSYQGLKIERT